MATCSRRSRSARRSVNARAFVMSRVSRANSRPRQTHGFAPGRANTHRPRRAVRAPPRATAARAALRERLSRGGTNLRGRIARYAVKCSPTGNRGASFGRSPRRARPPPAAANPATAAPATAARDRRARDRRARDPEPMTAEPAAAGRPPPNRRPVLRPRRSDSNRDAAPPRSPSRRRTGSPDARVRRLQADLDGTLPARGDASAATTVVAEPATRIGRARSAAGEQERR
jgi:hypothetical protein